MTKDDPRNPFGVLRSHPEIGLNCILTKETMDPHYYRKQIRAPKNYSTGASYQHSWPEPLLLPPSDGRQLAEDARRHYGRPTAAVTAAKNASPLRRQRTPVKESGCRFYYAITITCWKNISMNWQPPAAKENGQDTRRKLVKKLCASGERESGGRSGEMHRLTELATSRPQLYGGEV